MPNKAVAFNQSLKSISVEDLKARVQEDSLRLKKMKFTHVISPLENPSSIRQIRRDIARIYTELKKRELA